MEQLDFLIEYWPVLSGSYIAPVAAWLKKKLPGDFPLATVAISGLLSFLAIYLIALFFVPEATIKDIVVWAAGSHIFAQLLHAGRKTQKKNFLNP